MEALCRGGKGQYESALALLEDMLATAKRMGELFYLARSLNTIGWLYGELQDHRQAMTWNMQGVETAQEANFSIPEYQNNPVALQLRGMNMRFEGLKEKGSLIMVPSSALESMNLELMT